MVPLLVFLALLPVVHCDPPPPQLPADFTLYGILQFPPGPYRVYQASSKAMMRVDVDLDNNLCRDNKTYHWKSLVDDCYATGKHSSEIRTRGTFLSNFCSQLIKQATT